MTDTPLAKLLAGAPDLEAARQMAWRCLKCSVCDHIDVHQLRDSAPSRICPSADLFRYFSYTPAGRIEILRAAAAGEFRDADERDLERLVHIAYTCLMCGACEPACRRGVHPLVIAQCLRDWAAKLGLPSGAAQLGRRIRESGSIYGTTSGGGRVPQGGWGEQSEANARGSGKARRGREELVERLAGVVGGAWVSDDLPVRVAYARDASLAARGLPDLVVLPGSTAEVAGVLAVASRLGCPVTVRSTGLNLEGLTVPKRGGVVLDMVRMDKILGVDREGMSVTVQPGVTVGEVQAAAEASALRAAQPGAPASVSLMGNTLLLGLSITSVCYGTGADRIRALTLVLSTGEVLQLGQETFGTVSSGYDLTRIARCGNGRVGICTEMTIDLFPAGGRWRMGAAIYTKVDDLPPLDPLRRIARSAVAAYLCLFNRVTIAHQLATSDAEAAELEETLPPFLLIYGLRGYTQRELDAREADVRTCLQGSGWTAVDAGAVAGMFREFTGGSPALTRMGGEVCRWGRGAETIRWTKTWTSIGRIPSVYPSLREAIVRSMTAERSTPTGLYIQPYEYGRNAYLEIDYFPVLSDETRRERALEAARGFARQSAHLGLTGGIVAHCKRGSPYAGIEAALKATLDPAGILNPGGERAGYEPDICG